MRLVGDWTIRLLVITLALTPLQRILNWPKISLIRRMLGVTTFAYALTHFTLYIVQSKFDLVFVASEIVSAHLSHHWLCGADWFESAGGYVL